MNFDFSVDFSLTYYLLTIASFRIGVPSILFIAETIQRRKLFAEIQKFFSTILRSNRASFICMPFFALSVSCTLPEGTYLQPNYSNGVFGNVYLSAGQHQ